MKFELKPAENETGSRDWLTWPSFNSTAATHESIAQTPGGPGGPVGPVRLTFV